MKHLLRLILISTFFWGFSAHAQQTDIAGLDKDTVITNYSAYKRSIGFAGLLQTRYVASLTDNVDVNGKNFNDASTNKITNTFLLKRVRLQVKGTVNDHFSANLMVNFAEFSSDPSNKVLENAFVKYTLSKHFNVQAGQFRPFFGIEDALPVDIIRTLDYSNQYYAFGASGWQSFQVGVSVFGDVNKTGSVRYYAGVYNGNNRNQATDNDNEKNLYARIETSISKNLIIGINGATGSQGGGGGLGNAWGGDIVATHKFDSDWKLTISGEYKNGTNLSLYNTYTANPPGLSQVRMQGFYFFPVLRYSYNLPRVRAIEFSSRYEYFNDNYKLTGDPRQTIIPNITLIFADDMYAALQLGVAIDMYKNDVPLTTNYSHNLAYLQLQIRF
ncbi:porin [Mucilaginibacter jinjuensis]|uniref:Porin n=1 Tax=Mucilaginibacter jinjuensis TaxID=1176721 RepID=A0ABY7TEL6_9SPHI|nr:porin [Mucilaginibacter jinjuensis]WCT14808.1 porin [Mucilaginibacter jinjuensis]